MKGMSKIEFEYLVSLSSLYEALTLSAVDPVTIKNRIELGKGGNLDLEMFYDVFGDGSEPDLEFAETIMRKRIRESYEDIIKHDKYHSQLLNYFYDIDESININNRKRTSKTSKSICECVQEYISDVIIPHQDRLKDESFLYVPSCFKEYAFFIPHTKYIANLVFNISKTSDEAISELRDIIELSKEFSQLTGKIVIDKITTKEDPGEGLISTSLRGRYELNKELLNRLDFKL
jgi:hypothetical protein